MKRIVIINNKNGINDLPDELPNDLLPNDELPKDLGSWETRKYQESLKIL